MQTEIPLFIMREGAKLPRYQTSGAAGADLHAYLDEPYELKPMERAVVPTGIGIALPDGYEAQVRARSGLSVTFGVTTVNGVGTIDSDYRGEIGVGLINLSQEPFVVEPGMRIAQLVVARYEQAAWREVESLDVSERGEDGFGSTGVVD